MENKRNAILGMAGFIAVIAMIGFSITSCDFLEEMMHEHDYGTEWKTNATQHWQECECGDKIEVGNHTGNTTGYKCNVCNKAHEHIYGDTWTTNSTQHWKKCPCGSTKDTSNHSYFSWGSNATHHWKECSCGVKENNQNTLHSFSTTYKFDLTQHWRECECSYKSNVANHTSTTSCTTCTFDTTANPLFVGSWIRYTYYSDAIGYIRYTFNDDGTGFYETKYSSPDIDSYAIIWSAKGGQLTIAYADYDLSQTFTYLIENFTLSYWTDPSNKYILTRQAGDGSMDDRLVVDTWIYEGPAGNEELRFFSDGTASLTKKFSINSVENYIWTAKNGQYELYSVTGTGNHLPLLRESRTYIISGNTLNTSNSDGSGDAKAYTKKYGNGYEIGETGPGGGKVFYDKGNDKDGWRYIEAAPDNLGVITTWESSYTSISGASGAVIGTGKANTLAIIAACPDDTELNNAAKYAVSYRGGEKDDWYLPSMHELSEILSQIGFDNTNYYWWSSTQVSSSSVRVLGYAMGGFYTEYDVPKSQSNAYVRPVRYF